LKVNQLCLGIIVAVALLSRQQQHDVGHSVVATGCGALRLSFSILAFAERS